MIASRRWVARVLENGTSSRSLLRPIAALYARVADRCLDRTLLLPESSPVIGIGSAVLGGAGKTPVAIAIATSLAKCGLRVGFVAHGYRAIPLRPRIVEQDDDVRLVGDDALVAAQAVRGHNVKVWVGPDRQSALNAASEGAQVVVVDGLLQTRPQRLWRSLLVLDRLAPWGAGTCVPAGDLRARPEALLAASDAVVWVQDPLAEALDSPSADCCIPSIKAFVDLEGVRTDTQYVPLSRLATGRFGLLLLVARPQRVLDTLHRRGVRWCCAWLGADHHRPGLVEKAAIRRLARQQRLDGWIVTPKCRVHLKDCDWGAPILTVDMSVRLDPRWQKMIGCAP